MKSNFFQITCTSFLTIISAVAHAQSKVVVKESFWSNGPKMLMLLSVIILLAVIIILGKILKALIQNDTKELWNKRRSSQGTKMLAFILLTSFSANAQEEAAAVANNTQMFGMEASLFWIMLSVLIFEFIVIGVLSYVLYIFLLRKNLIQPIKNVLPKWMQFNTMLGNDIPIEKDSELMTDHDYDGIKELDNGMPPMLKYIFVGSIVFALIYWVNYHVIETAPLMIAEYENELEKAAIEKEAYLKKAGNLMDENNVTLSDAVSVLSTGEKVYLQNCLACHGDKGQGGVGPNLTDNYWIHGGDIKSVFKTIKYGVVSKGMRSWQSELKPSDIHAVSSFILNKLTGTNVIGGKEPQGEPYNASGANTESVQDSSVVVKDSIKN